MQHSPGPVFETTDGIDITDIDSRDKFVWQISPAKTSAFYFYSPYDAGAALASATAWKVKNIEDISFKYHKSRIEIFPFYMGDKAISMYWGNREAGLTGNLTDIDKEVFEAGFFTVLRKFLSVRRKEVDGMAGNYEPRTNEELQAMDEILPQDKQLITKILEAEVGLDDNDIRVRAIRGYLVGMILDCEVDGQLREELEGDAASFSDGWTGALENAITPEILDALKAQHQAIDRLFAELIQRDSNFFPSKSGQPWEAAQKGNALIQKLSV